MKLKNEITITALFLIFLIAAIAVETSVKVPIGKYSANPSFKAEVDYDFKIYSDISKIIDDLVKKCSDLPDSCAINFMKGIENKDYKFYFKHMGKPVLEEGWPEICESGQEDFFYDFIEFYTDCAGTEDDNCRCEMPLERYFSGEATVAIQKEDDKIAFLLEEKGISNAPDGFYIESFPSKITYNDNEANVEGIGSQKILILLKKDGKISFVDEDAEGLPEKCKIDNRFYKACVIGQKMIFAKNPSSGKTEVQNNVLRFAFETINLPPPPVEEVNAFDKKKASNRVIVKWNESDAIDLAKYAIYYSTSDFLQQNLNKCAESGACERIETQIRPNEIIEYIDLEQEPFFDDISVSYEYSFKKEGKDVLEELEDSALYKVESDKEKYYFYILNNIDNEVYYNIAVTAVDIKGNEIDNEKEDQKLKLYKNYVNQKSTDDVPAGKASGIRVESVTKELFWNPPGENIDGTLLDLTSDVDYEIYELGEFGDLIRIGGISDPPFPITDVSKSYKILPIKDKVPVSEKSAEWNYLLDIFS